MATKTYTSKNQYNYSIKQLTINFDNKTYELRYGGQCRIAKKNSSTKAINEKVEELKAIGFKEITASQKENNIKWHLGESLSKNTQIMD